MYLASSNDNTEDAVADSSSSGAKADNDDVLVNVMLFLTPEAEASRKAQAFFGAQASGNQHRQCHHDPRTRIPTQLCWKPQETANAYWHL
jgi:hypothetical protein